MGRESDGRVQYVEPSVPPLASTEEVRQARDTLIPTEGATVATIENFSYALAEVGVGDTLTWTNVDGVPHTVTAGLDGEAVNFDSGLIGPGQSFAVRFDQPGVFPFACALHPSMTGVCRWVSRHLDVQCPADATASGDDLAGD